MKHWSNLKVGDKVIPNEKCTLYRYKDQLGVGVIHGIDHVGDYIVKFENECERTHNCDEKLEEDNGWFLTKGEAGNFDLFIDELKFKVGDKVVPISKSVCWYGTLESSCQWELAENNDQPFLYIIGIRDVAGEPSVDYRCSRHAGSLSGDFFMEGDLIPYIEEKRNFVVLKQFQDRVCNQYKLIVSDNTTVVILPGGTKGVAKCLPEDKFDVEIGEAIALQRALIKYHTKKLKKLIK